MSNSKSTLIVKEVTTKKELRKFVNFPMQLYKDVPQFVPPFYGDDLDDWNPDKNPAFMYCEAKCFLAYRDGEIVGRIGAILSKKANEIWNKNRMRFSQVDFIDDLEVSKALFKAVEDWAKEKGCDQVHGPLGFCDLDREGMLVEGYEHKNMFITYYNHPYYNEHLQKLGYIKDTDWIEYKIPVPEIDSREGQLLIKMSERVQSMYKIKPAVLKSRKDYGPYIKKIFELVNICYSHLYGVVPLNDQQINRYYKKYIPLVGPDCACFVMNEENEMVGFGLCAPSMADALKKSNGRLFPFGWIGVLKSLKTNDTLDMYLIAVKPEYQGKGVNAVILDYFLKRATKNHIKFALTGPQLETNSKILGQWKMFAKEQYKRRRCYIKDL